LNYTRVGARVYRLGTVISDGRERQR